MVSDPVATPFGFHLIQVTDRKEGKEPDFDQNKTYILTQYAADLQKEIVSAEKKLAKIDIKPMPKDLFPPAAPATALRPRTPSAKPNANPRRFRHNAKTAVTQTARVAVELRTLSNSRDRAWHRRGSFSGLVRLPRSRCNTSRVARHCGCVGGYD